MRTLLICAALMASPAFAGQVFKCKEANGGTVFSPTPCGKDAKEVTLRAGNQGAPTLSTSAVHEAKPPTPVKVDAVRDISDVVADTHCREDAHTLWVEPNTSSLVHAQEELSALERRQWSGGSNANRQILEENDQTHMASLRSLIATEKQNASATRADSQRRVDDAIAKCDVRKREVEESRKRGD